MANSYKVLISITLIFMLQQVSFTEEIDYSNQLTWGTECIDDNKQSPINIPTSLSFLEEVGNLKILRLNYSPLKNTQQVLVGGHYFTFKYDTVVDNHIVLEKFSKEYKFTLSNVHLHCPAEHQIDSTIEYPCELHLVHQRLISGADKDKTFKFLVVGLLLKESGVADNQLFGTTDMDFSNIVTKNYPYYYYEGSLTTPPCSEQVNWLIRAEPVNTSKAQLDILKNWVNSVFPGVGNDRNVQNTGERKVYYIPALSNYISINIMFVLALLFLVFN
jgi:carbonic anhydrase